MPDTWISLINSEKELTCPWNSKNLYVKSSKHSHLTAVTKETLCSTITNNKTGYTIFYQKGWNVEKYSVTKSCTWHYCRSMIK
jgi:hypothetical protein